MSKNKLNISPKSAIISSISICAVFTLVLVWLANSSYQNYVKTEKKLAQTNSYLISLEKDAKDLEKLLQKYKAERKHLEEILFDDKDIAAFLNKIGDFAKSSQIKITEMRAQRFENVKIPQELEAGLNPIQKEAMKKKQLANPQLAALPIKMSIEARFDRIIDFLLSLEKYRQLLTLSNVSIRRGSYPLLTCDFTLRLYSLKKLEEILK